MQKLSSGLRINSAADDAAGLAIAQKMHTQVRGLKQANRNSMDGISLIQTAEGALNEVHSMLQRTRELSIQASNGTLTASDRKAITDEVAQLKAEIDRISEHIEYNERKLLNGEIDRRKFSDKDTAGKVISMSDAVKAGEYIVNITSPATQTTVVGDVPKDNLYDKNGKVFEEGIININGESVTIKAGDTEQEVFGKVRNLCDTMGLDISVNGGGGYTRDSRLIIVHREYGEQEIKIEGGLSLLEGLGLDVIGEARASIITGDTPDGSLYTTELPREVQAELEFEINGESVFIEKKDTEEDVFAKIKSACNNVGIDLKVEGGGDYQFNSQLIMLHRENGEKPITITSEKSLKGLGLDIETETKTEITGNIPRINLYDEEDKVRLPTGQFEIAGQRIKIEEGMTTDEVMDAITLAGTKASPGFVVKQDSMDGRLIITSKETGPNEIEVKTLGENGEVILAGLGLIDPLINKGTDNKTLNAYSGVLRGTTKGQNVKIDDKNLHGFPDGSTFKVKGNIVTFEGNNNFKLAIEAGQTKKESKTGDFENGNGMVTEKLRGNVTLTLLETGPLDLQIGANEGQMMQLRIQNMSTTALGLDNMNLNTADKSQEAIGLVDAAIAQVSSARSKLGAYQNRLEHTVANLDVAAENMTASMSRIQDADMAAEMSEYTKDNILAQAGNAMLAQANQRPQQILQLLQ